VLERLVVHSCPVVVGSDFNINVETPDDTDARRLQELLTMFDMRQHVNVPTHRHGGTLDLVMTFADYEPQQVCVDPGCILSDHKVVTCQIPVTVGQEEVAERIVRDWRRVDRGVLRRTLQDSPLCYPVPENVTVNELFAVYDSVLRDIGAT